MGIENSENINLPGFVFFIKFNEHYREEYQQYIENGDFIHIPTEYYMVEWKSFLLTTNIGTTWAGQLNYVLAQIMN